MMTRSKTNPDHSQAQAEPSAIQEGQEQTSQLNLPPVRPHNSLIPQLPPITNPPRRNRAGITLSREPSEQQQEDSRRSRASSPAHSVSNARPEPFSLDPRNADNLQFILAHAEEFKAFMQQKKGKAVAEPSEHEEMNVDQGYEAVYQDVHQPGMNVGTERYHRTEPYQVQTPPTVADVPAPVLPRSAHFAHTNQARPNQHQARPDQTPYQQTVKNVGQPKKIDQNAQTSGNAAGSASPFQGNAQDL